MEKKLLSRFLVVVIVVVVVEGETLINDVINDKRPGNKIVVMIIKGSKTLAKIE